MGWLDKLLGREKRAEDEVTPEEHHRHVEQSANPGTAPVVRPDTSEESADELEEARQEPRGDERVEEARLQDDPETGAPGERPPSY
jgi:hypothetical protein